MNIKATTIDEYIAGFPPSTQVLLEQMRAIIKATAPEAQETIKYAIPTFTLAGNLIYFAGYKNHIGLYATPTGNKAFEQELSIYKTGKGSIQFPIDQPLPLDLITRIVEFRVQQNLEKAPKKKKTGAEKP